MSINCKHTQSLQNPESTCMARNSSTSAGSRQLVCSCRCFSAASSVGRCVLAAGLCMNDTQHRENAGAKVWTAHENLYIERRSTLHQSMCEGHS